MAKKRKRTRPVMTRKQRRARSKPSSHHTGEPEIKISEAILRLCEPLRKQYQAPHRTQAIVSITVMAWNISLFPEEERPHVQGMLLDALPKELGGEEIAVLLEHIDRLIAQKEHDFPHIREYILHHQLTFSGETITLSVGTAPVPEKIQRRVS